jgi:hypothetical protein
MGIMRRAVLQFIFAICVVAYSYAGALINCPDCGSQVSERAVMCPQCGCPASGIIEAVELKHAAEKLRAPHPVVRVQTDSAKGYAVVVADATDKSYLLFDASLLDAATSLSVTLLSTNIQVKYQNLQLAQNEPLARFVTKSTNVISLVSGSEKISEDNYMWLIPDILNECIYTGKVEIADDYEVMNDNIDLIAAVDAYTNLIGVIYSNGETKSIAMLTNELEWITVSPLIYRNQTYLLVKAEAMAKEGEMPDGLIKELKNTEWVTTVLENRVKKILTK